MQDVVRIEKLTNGMVLFENGNGNLIQMPPELVKSIIIFPPDRNHPMFGNENCRWLDRWRVQVAGEGYIVFITATHDEANEILKKINEVLE